jgi:hypothetical protein
VAVELIDNETKLKQWLRSLAKHTHAARPEEIVVPTRNQREDEEYGDDAEANGDMDFLGEAADQLAEVEDSVRDGFTPAVMLYNFPSPYMSTEFSMESLHNTESGTSDSCVEIETYICNGGDALASSKAVLTLGADDTATVVFRIPSARRTNALEPARKVGQPLLKIGHRYHQTVHIYAPTIDGAVSMCLSMLRQDLRNRLTPYVVAAAVRGRVQIYGVPAPKRHQHAVDLAVLNGESLDRIQHGFVLGTGRFVSKGLALACAVLSGQLAYDTERTELAPEDIW